jgi:hypothetical protein
LRQLLAAFLRIGGQHPPASEIAARVLEVVARSASPSY